MERVVAVIPARMGSTRFPGKPLAPLLGIPMVEHVYRRTAQNPLLAEVVVATCDEEIRRATEAFGGRAIMTSEAHTRASGRVAEAMVGDPASVALMVQGDEPMVTPEMITESLTPLLDEPQLSCVNLLAQIDSVEELEDPNTIKVATDQHGDALFFSRAPIPSRYEQSFDEGRWFKQVCIISFRRAALEAFSALEPTPLEVAESVDMLRFLEHGMRVRMVPTNARTYAVDTPADLKHVEALLAKDPFTHTYLGDR